MARSSLRIWYMAATERDQGRGIKMRIMFKKLENVQASRGVRVALWKMRRNMQREGLIEQGLAEITEEREQRVRLQMFGHWRHRYAVKEMDKVVREQSRRKLLGYCITSMIAFKKLSQLQRQDLRKV